ncbi:MAG: Gfo/Idh/MocA family oxidoreductase [Clostridia bacterium]|nr:Gfo/Idh/MocA family oxidoreductase [Clostridia bacterium]
MKKIRIGVLGGYRGKSMMHYAEVAQDAELVAVCDKYPDVIEQVKEDCGTDGVTYYDNFEDFLQHDMDAVVLANYANEHAPFAIRCLKAGKHVFSEVLPVQTMKEAVELIEAVEESGLVYAYGENYCYMPGPYEMRRLYREGKLGEFEYGEGEYIHNCEPIWPRITYGDPTHWRNWMYSTFYCTHSLGPIIHITGLRPVRVTGYEGPKTERNLRTGALGGAFGMEMVELENGGIVKSIHGGLYKNSIWYTIYGSLGRAETAREDADAGNISCIYVNTDEASGAYDTGKLVNYEPTREHSDIARSFGHGNSDFYTMYNFVKKIRGEEDADTIDVYEALDMFLPGMFAYRSVLAGGIPMEIPNLRNADEREKWRSDTACTDPKVAGDQLLPTQRGGTPEIPQEVYEKVYKDWRKMVEKQS